MAETTLEKMAKGGVYDQLAGGFHRYSVDERWLVPHFEKMSYDNSELLKNYLHGWQVTQNPFLRETAEGIIGWVNEVLSDQANGGFYASQDADYSLDDDGDYFTWTLNELRAVLPPADARIMELYYDVEPHGEMHHNPEKNVLWIARDADGNRENPGTGRIQRAAQHCVREREDARGTRSCRPTPFIDQTMYVSWNAMFVSAYLDAAGALGGSIGTSCKDFALKTLDRMLREAWSEEEGFAHRIGGPALRGSLDDQVFGVMALLDAYEATLDAKYFQAARRTMDMTIEKYGDAEGGALLRSRLRCARNGWSGRAPQAVPGFADAERKFGGRHGAHAHARLHRRSEVLRLGQENAGGLRRCGAAVRSFRRDLRTGGDAFRRASHASGHHRRRGRSRCGINWKKPRTASTASARRSCASRPKRRWRISRSRYARRCRICPKDKAQALVCAGTTCLPPTSDPEELKANPAKGNCRNRGGIVSSKGAFEAVRAA